MSAASTMTQRFDVMAARSALYSRVHLIVLAAITVLAAILRFYRLGDWSFWIDEMFTLGHTQAHYSSLALILQNTPPNTNWIPLSVISTGAALNAFGVSEWSARLVPALIGIASIPLLYFPIRRLLDTWTALIAVLLLALSPWHLFWSQNARFYTALLLFYSLALFAFYFGIERDRPRYLLFFIGLTYLAASERLLALFIVPVLGSYLLFLAVLRFEKPPGFRTRNLILVALPLLIGGVIEVYSILATGGSRFFGGFTFLIRPSENPAAQGIFILYELGIPLVILSFFCGLYLVVQRNRIGLFFLLGAVVPYCIVILIAPLMFTEERYVFVTLTSWLALAAIAVKELLGQSKGYGRILATGVLIILVADAIGDNLLYFRANDGNRRDYKGAFALVEEQSREDDVIVSTWPQLGEYYLQREVVSWQEIDPDTVIRSGKRVWFVIIPELSWFWQEQKWPAQDSELIGVKYLRRPDDASLYIYLYDTSRNKP